MISAEQTALLQLQLARLAQPVPFRGQWFRDGFELEGHAGKDQDTKKVHQKEPTRNFKFVKKPNISPSRFLQNLCKRANVSMRE